MNSLKKRDTNFELLRIISMLMIIMHHAVLHSDLIKINDFGIKKIVASFLLYGGKIGVILFVLISGYYMINSKFKIKKIISLFSTVLFFSLSIELIFIIFKLKNISPNDIFKSFIPISSNTYWFITSYFALYLFSPFINKVIKNLTQEQLKNLLVSWFIILSLPMIFIKKGFYNDSLFFIWIYSLGSYFRLYNVEFLNKRKNRLCLFCLSNIFLIIFVMICGYLSSKTDMAIKGITHFSSINSLPMLINAVLIFYIFKNINISENEIICSIAKRTFAIYLIHENYNVRYQIWKKLLNLKDIYVNNNVIFLIIYIIGISLVIFVFCYFIELIRSSILKKINIKNKKIDNLLNKIDSIFNI